MNLEHIDTSTTAGEKAEWLSSDDAQIALFQAIRDIKFGLPTDDKLILENLRNAGLWIARYQPERAPRVGPESVWVSFNDGGFVCGTSRTPCRGYEHYIRADLAGEKS